MRHKVRGPRVEQRRLRRRALLRLRGMGYEGELELFPLAKWIRDSRFSSRRALVITIVGAIALADRPIKLPVDDQQALRTARRPRCGKSELILELAAAFVPQRIANEEIGDALELLAMQRVLGGSRWWRAAKVASTLFWVGLAAVREIVASLNGKKVS